MAIPKQIVICSHRLGGADGVSIEAAKWQAALCGLGCAVTTVAGSGPVDVVLPGLSADAQVAPAPVELEDAFAGADLVIVENLCSLKLNPAAAKAVCAALCGRPAMFRHHDLAIERPDRLALGPPEDDPAWTHVCLSDRARDVLRRVGIDAVRMYNRFDPDPPCSGRDFVRAALGIGEQERLVLQPTRAIARKGVPLGVEIAECLNGIYFLMGRAEDGYDDELAAVLKAAKVRVIRGTEAPVTMTIDDAYAACDLVALPSTWEGFGNPSVESATHRRPLAIGSYPVGAELAALGFRWFPATAPERIASHLATVDAALIEHNAGLARRHFSLSDLPERLLRLFG